jgi:short-subunit dehydrogenase
MRPVTSAGGILRLKVRHVVLAGADGEIGRRLVPALASGGSRLTLLGADAARLAQLARQAEQAGARTLVMPCASLPADAPTLVRKAIGRFGPIDCLVNAAAIGCGDPPAGAPDPVAEDMLQVNLAAPIRLAQAVLPGMLRRRRGRIVNVGSVFGAVGLPGLTLYCASMFGLHGYSEALRRELAGSGVSVVHVAPRHGHGAEDEEATAGFAASLGLELDGPELIAAAVLEAIESRSTADPAAGWPERLIGSLNAVFPALLDRVVVRRRRRIRAVAAAPAGQPAGASPGGPRLGAEAGRVIPIHPLKGR